MATITISSIYRASQVVRAVFRIYKNRKNPIKTIIIIRQDSPKTQLNNRNCFRENSADAKLLMSQFSAKKILAGNCIFLNGVKYHLLTIDDYGKVPSRHKEHYSYYDNNATVVTKPTVKSKKTNKITPTRLKSCSNEETSVDMFGFGYNYCTPNYGEPINNEPHGEIEQTKSTLKCKFFGCTDPQEVNGYCWYHQQYDNHLSK